MGTKPPLDSHTHTTYPHSSLTMDKLKGMASKFGSGSGGSNTAASSDPNAANTAGQSTNQGDALDKGVGMASNSATTSTASSRRRSLTASEAATPRPPALTCLSRTRTKAWLTRQPHARG